MRRSRNHQRSQHQMSPSGPLLTSHLRDLDIELELLKRKREIIEQEQNILNRERYPTKRQYDYNTLNQYDRQEPKPNIQSFNYSQYYDDSSHSGNYRSQGVKRKPESQNYSLPSKRFNAPQTINPWQTDLPQPGPSQPSQYSAPKPAPLMGLKIHNMGPRPQKQIRPFRKNSQPSKVTKPKPQPAPNKLASYPVEKTKKLVTQAMKAIDRKPDETQILRADRDPTVQVKGRLELALGMVMKQMKQDHCSEPEELEYFVSPFMQRLLKHTIRTRIRNVMMGQYVGAASDIVEAYRLKYPKETDIELIKVAKDAQCPSGPQLGAIQLIDADDPEEFYKKNMTKILNNKLEDMFSKLQSMYSNAGPNLNDYVEKLPELSKDNEKEPKTLTIEGMCGEDGSLTSISENIAKIKLYTKFMEELIEDRLPKIIPKFKNLLFSILFSEKEFLGIKAMIAAQLKRKILKTIEKDDTSLIRNKKVVSDKSVDKASASIEMDIEQTKPEVNKPSIETTKSPPETHTNEMKEDDITKEAKENASEVNIKTELGTTEIDKPASVETPVPVTPNKSAPTPSAQTPQTPLGKDLLYVKLIGRPVLPARAVIYDFLKKFNPASIKKHKSISNLLVLAFSDRENFDKILTANESIVGESTIIIKSSEQVNINKQTPDLNKTMESSPASKDLPATNTSNVNKDLNDSNASNETKRDDGLILNSDLDTQITDLLMSIRKCEEDVGIVEGGNKIEDNVPVAEASKEINVVSKKCDGDIEVEAKNDDTPVQSNEDKTTEKPTDTESAQVVPDANESTNIDVNKTNSLIKPSDTQQSNAKTVAEDSYDNSKTDVKEKTELEAIKESNEDNENKESTEKPGDKPKANVNVTGCATPSRTSSRLASVKPSTIKTRRASRLAQNN